MTSNKKDLVWYACYGSNIDEFRFLKYLQGGTLRTIGNTTKTYQPCPTDTNPPVSSRPYILRHKLIFGLKSQQTWPGYGVAFIGNRKNKKTMTYAKLYLISKDQFNYLFALENSRKTINIDYPSLHKKGRLDFDFTFYSRLILLENSFEGYPVYTFTNSGKPYFNGPCKEYIEYIAKGIIDTHKLKLNDLVTYFSKLKTGFKKADIRLIIEKLFIQ